MKKGLYSMHEKPSNIPKQKVLNQEKS